MSSPEVFIPATASELSDWLRSSGSDAGPAITGKDDPDPAAALADSDRSPGLAVVSTSRFAEVTSFRPRDLTIEVGAGIRMQRILEVVGEKGLWIPAAGIGAARSAGGWIAAASPGMWDASHGPTRRQLLGCRVAAPGGMELTWGRAVMKNVAGYDIPRLMAGSRGRLGVLTRVTLRLWPRPAAISAWVIRGAYQPSILESAEADAVAWRWTGEAGAHAVAMFAGSASSVRRREQELSTRVRASGAEILEADAGRESIEGTGERRPGSVVCRLTPGRRNLQAAFEGLVRWGHPGLAAIEAFPESGCMLVTLAADRSGIAPLSELQEQLPQAEAPGARTGGRRMEIGIERGGPSEHEAAAALRDPGMIAIERRIETALDAWPRTWQADYL
jgi:hypothetical protein